MNTLTSISFVLGFVGLILGGELLVRGSSRLAVAIGIPPLIIGLTVTAFGTSAPELAVMLRSAFSGQPELIVGNVVGSNIANVLLILGLAALAATLVVPRRLIWIEVPLMIAVSLALLLLSLDGRISRMDGIFLFVGFLAHLLFMIREQRGAIQATPREAATEPHIPKEWLKNSLLILGGLALLIIAGGWLVNGAVAMARSLGVNELIIGLTIIAVGTSLPEMATSIIAGLRGERDIAVGNVVGSNIFNILSGLGLTAIVAPNGIDVSQAALRFDIPVMIAAAVACLPIFYIGHRISRWEGGLFFGYYLAYTLYLILTAKQHQAISPFSVVMMWFVIPLTVVTLAIFVYRTARATRYQTVSATGVSKHES